MQIANRILYKILLLIFLTGFWGLESIALEIKGKIDLKDEWQPKVFLASLNSPEDLFVASPDFIIAETFVEPDGTYRLESMGVPNELRFYRLYLVKGNNSQVEFNSSENRNYIHLLLSRNSKVELNINTTENSVDIAYFEGSEANKQLFIFDLEYMRQKEQLSGEITKAKRDYLTLNLENYIREFIQSASNSFVGLYALYHLEDKDVDFLKNSDFYFSFEKQLTDDFPGTSYAQAYSELLTELVGFRDMVCKMPGIQPKWKDQLLIAQGGLICILIVVIIILSVRKKKNVLAKETKQLYDTFSNLTSKEKEILKLLYEGKTNKEIARDLFVELSTVKTHINSIYKQINVTNRKEAIQYYSLVKE